LVDKIINYLPYEVSVEYSDSTPGDQFGIYGDTTKIEKELGWKYQTDLDEGLKLMVNWNKERQ